MNVRIVFVDTPLLVAMPFSGKYALSRDLELKYAMGDYTETVIIPTGFLTDGASIPKIAWSLIGTPFEPRFITAAIVHDYMCDNNWDVDVMSDIFKLLLQLSNVPSDVADLMYRAVYLYKSIV
ncbi:hypothetical protein S144_45 [Shewanella sp. phage 1/44]|uniref:tail assembly chaperone n=1 Tax=Shewanella sp. phage 1/44 TaxID=1458862 RepID=UPI0004F8C74D|nr:tail assembly chaperone [Shewanella sp. phage 1/44]AHK11759.1 hypothetical protein S144_45 [Shewanella sp. phage 1/44]